ncbi:MAG: peptidoglycan editing factor PgeF [Nitrospinae bacterium]|nr:peptidoglycan editing factor PgeF [Nitrospinota bacterium]
MNANGFARYDGVEAHIYRFETIHAAGFPHFVTGRGGGVSPAPYHSLNTDYNGGDSHENVRRNIGKVLASAGLEKLWTPKQVHGDIVAVINGGPAPEVVEADAVITATPGMAVGVRTADCLPLLLVDTTRKVVAAVHAGRRSTELHIARKTVNIMRDKFGCAPPDIVAAIGPCIRACCYEVDLESAGRFHSCCGGSGGRMLDIAGANLAQLKQAGVENGNITDCGICTACENHRFYSYRKDGKVTGRFLSAVALS